MKGVERITIIGAGNVAWHLAAALAEVADVRQVISRHEASARALAVRVNECASRCGRCGVCSWGDSLADIDAGSDLYLIAANDDAVAAIASSTADYGGIWAHTSGSVGLEVFSGCKQRYGSFYPLQTFSRAIDVDVRRVPFFVEGSSDGVLGELESLAGEISDKVYRADSQRRRALHVAAVFACNFANQMWADADRLLKDQGLDITCLLPLLEATLGKLGHLSPAEAMTGPARRGDLAVMRSHMAELPADLREVYRVVSQQILDASHPGMRLC